MIQHPDKNYIDSIKVQIRDQHPYCFHVDEEPDGKLWYHDNQKFLAIREYLENATNGKTRALMRLENHFFLNGVILYRMTPDLGLLICVHVAEATRLLEEIHTGTCRRRNMRTPYEWVHISQETFESWIHLDDYGKQQYLLRIEVSPVPNLWGFHPGSAKWVHPGRSPFGAWT
nr:uncharacterized protein LOC117274271 [Nicotiana tomentosiformis]